MILILLPIWKRESITDLCLKNLYELKKNHDIDVLCVVSEQWAKIKAFDYGFKWVECENFPVSNKMNVGIEAALRYDFDYLMNLGSDDLISERLFEIYEPYIKEKRECFGITKITFLNSTTKELKRFDYKHMVGAGRMIRKDILKKYAPIYPEGINKCLDDNSARKMFGVQFTELNDVENDLIIDIKSDENIWDFDFFEAEKLDFNLLNAKDEILTDLIEL